MQVLMTVHEFSMVSGVDFDSFLHATVSFQSLSFINNKKILVPSQLVAIH